MKFGLVIGNVVATQKDSGVSNRKLLLIQPLDDAFKPSGGYLVAVDAVGAGESEIILFASGSSARQTELTKDTPCDCVIMAIVDQVECNGKIVFNKSDGLPSI
ncbi:EutN/CcmL family microcompartment protein [bacterium]|nr:EutN/CcmL family microcompartment protein [candidate division CSSED10-310 bacterium]